jgi:hypothetical protein
MPQLQDHLISRLMGRNYDNEEQGYSDKERFCLSIWNDRLYRHKVLRINYITYDMRRNQDSIIPQTHADIMTLSQEEYIQDDN